MEYIRIYKIMGGYKTMKKTVKQTETEKLLLDYLAILENNPEERNRMNKALQKETKKLAKHKETEMAAMFMAAIRF